MQLANARRYLFLARTFRNGWELIGSHRQGRPCGRAVLWNGATLTHPPRQGGLVGTILELWLDQCYTANGFYEPADGDVIIDAGAHVGLFACWAARRNPAAQVVALEPCADNYHCLRTNLAEMGASSVRALRLAVGGGDGFGRIEAATERSIDHRLVRVPQHDPAAVPIVSLAGLLALAGTDRVAFLKMDIEGAEYDAFAEADSATLARFDRIALEYHDNLRPGTLALLRARLEPTHHLTVIPTESRGYGVLLAGRKT